MKTRLYLEHGKPMLFGKNKEFGLIQEGTRFKVVKIGENGIRMEDILVHNAWIMMIPRIICWCG